MNTMPPTIYLWRNNLVEGPLATSDVAENLRNGVLDRDVQFVFDQTEQWRPLQEIELGLLRLALTTAANRQLAVDFSCNQCGGKIAQSSGASKAQPIICPHCGQKTTLTVPFNPAYAQPTSPGQAQRQSSSSGPASSSGASTTNSIAGSFCIVLGLAIAGYYFLLFDVSAPGSEFGNRVANIDLLNTRQNGVIIGIGIAISRQSFGLEPPNEFNANLEMGYSYTTGGKVLYELNLTTQMETTQMES